MHLDFGDLVSHASSGRVGRFVVVARRYHTEGAWVYFVGDRRPRWVPEMLLREPESAAGAPTEQGGARSAAAEALRWFRENLDDVDFTSSDVLAAAHAKTIVRAALAGARPAPADASWPGPGSEPGTFDRIVAKVQRSWPQWSELHGLTGVDRAIEHAVHVTISMLQQEAGARPAPAEPDSNVPDGFDPGARVWSGHSGHHGVVVAGEACSPDRLLVRFDGEEDAWHVKRAVLHPVDPKPAQPGPDAEQAGGERDA